MAHGDKKWIKDFSGKWKKSSDRTKKDYYKGLERWDRWGYFYNRSTNETFCPQCKHFADPIHKEQKRIEDKNHAIYVAFREQYPKWSDNTKAARIEFMNYLTFREYFAARDKMMEERTRDFTEFQKHYPIKREDIWHYDLRSYLCDKHRTWDDKTNEMWRENAISYPFEADRRRQYYRFYRAEVKNFMRSTDWEDYDDVPAYRKAWLD